MNKINGKNINGHEKHDIIYIFNTQSALCYGFSGVMVRLQNQFHSKLDFTILTKPKEADEKKMDIEDINLAIQQIKQIGKDCNVYFHDQFFENLKENPVNFYETHMPARALAAFRIYNFEQSVSYANDIQQLVFSEGRSISDTDMYLNTAEKYGVNPDDFLHKMNSTEIEQIVQNEYKMVQNMGISKCPTLLLKKGKKIDPLFSGCKPYDWVEKLLDEKLESE
ncbi:MAG: DsbA family protein [Bacteroidota bacterium]